MGCGCGDRLRVLLEFSGYELNEGTWIKENRDPIPDIDVDSRHFSIALRALIQEMSEVERKIMKKRIDERMKVL